MDTPSTRKDLKEVRVALHGAVSQIRATVEQYDLPETYADFTGLMEKQIAAIDHLLDDGTLGCELSSLGYKEEALINKPHLVNLAHVALLAMDMDPEQSKDFIDKATVALHIIKEKMAVKYAADTDIRKFLEPAKRTPGTPDASRGRSI